MVDCGLCKDRSCNNDSRYDYTEVNCEEENKGFKMELCGRCYKNFNSRGVSEIQEAVVLQVW